MEFSDGLRGGHCGVVPRVLDLVVVGSGCPGMPFGMRCV